MIECPCGRPKEYTQCCGEVIAGSRAADTAEDLMRARYCAYVRGELGYLWGTLHPKSRKGHDPESTRDWSENSKWLGLEIVKTEEGGVDDSVGQVEFIARYERDGEVQEHHELSHFRRFEGEWAFDNGKVVGSKPTVREEPKVGRNDPCPCGSGKKHKKCCA